MIDVREAVKMAHGHLKDLYGEEKIEAARLEEVELSDNSAYWFITLGFVVEDPAQLPFLPTQEQSRQYKIFKMDAEDGRLLSMKIREP